MWVKVSRQFPWWLSGILQTIIGQWLQPLAAFLQHLDHQQAQFSVNDAFSYSMSAGVALYNKRDLWLPKSASGGTCPPHEIALIACLHTLGGNAGAAVSFAIMTRMYQFGLLHQSASSAGISLLERHLVATCLLGLAGFVCRVRAACCCPVLSSFEKNSAVPDAATAFSRVRLCAIIPRVPNRCCLVQADLIPTCRELGIGIVAYSPLGECALSIPQAGYVSFKIHHRLSAVNVCQSCACHCAIAETSAAFLGCCNQLHDSSRVRPA